jgi:hypothetical protein
MLPHVADEEDAIVSAESSEERVDLFGARQTRFVEHIEPLPFNGRRLAAREIPLHRVRDDAGFA